MTNPGDEAPARTQPARDHRHRYHHGDLAQALVTAVRALVERDGPDRLSVSEACRMAGVSTAAPYRHFRDKLDILRHVCAEGFHELHDAMVAAAGAVAQPGPERLAAIGRSYVAFALAHPGAFRVMFGMKRELADPDDPARPMAAQECFAVVIAEVARAAELPPEDDDVRRLAVLLWTFVHGAATLKLDGDYEAVEIAVDTDAMIDVAARRLLAGVRPA